MAEVGKAVVSVIPSAKGFGKSLSKQVDPESKKVGKSVGGGFGKAFAIAGGATAIVGGLAKSISLAKDFDLTIRQVGVASGASGAELKSLSALAMKMGADTAFSAKDASDAMLELSKGGMTAAQIKGGALATTLKLAAAGGLELGSASTFVVQGMTTFGLAASDANRVAVALAGGANASTASVESLGQALSQVGPGAKNAGLSLEETVATLSAFDNAGIKGSDAGTSLKTMLTRLVPATDKASTAMDAFGLSFVDSKGNIDDIATVAEKLKNKLGPLSQEQRTQALATIFGSDATRAASVLMDNGRKGIEKYIRATKDQSTVQKMANSAMGGASGAWDTLTGSIETLQIKLGTALLPTFTKVSKALAGVANDVGDFVTQMQSGKGAGGQFADTLGDVFNAGKNIVSALTPIAKMVGALAAGFTKLPGPVRTFAFELGLAALVFPRIRSALGGLPSALTSPIQSARNFGNEMRNVETRAAAVGRVMNGLKNVAGIGGMALMTDGARRSSGALKELETVGGAALTGFAVGGPIGAAVAGGGTALFRLATAGTRAGKQIEAAKPGIGSIVSTLNAVSGAATKATRDLTFNSIVESGGLAAFNKVKGAYSGLAITERDLVDAAMGNVGAQRRVTAALNTATSSVKKSAAGDSSKYKATQDVMKATGTLNKVIGVNAAQNKKATATERAHFRATATTAQLLKRGMAPAATTAASAVGNLGRKSQRSAKDVHGVGSAIKAVPSKKNVDLNVDTHGSESKVNTLRAQIQDLQDRTIHIRTITNKPKVLPTAATGTNFAKGGATLVGERGPEIVNLPRGSQVIPNHKIHGEPVGMASGQRLYLVLDNGQQFGAYVSDRAARQVVAYSGVTREAARAKRP